MTSRTPALQEMNLLDWFAAMAMMGLCQDRHRINLRSLSEDAYEIAEIMIETRHSRYNSDAPN